MAECDWWEDDERAAGDDEPLDDPASTTVPCPECGRAIFEDAPQCPHCGQYVTADTSPWSGRPWWWLLLGLLGAAALAGALTLGL